MVANCADALTGNPAKMAIKMAILADFLNIMASFLAKELAFSIADDVFDCFDIIASSLLDLCSKTFLILLLG